MTYPHSFKDGEFGWVPSAFFGGPIDGARYRMPILPDGSIPTSMSHPLEGELFGFPFMAVYNRHGDEPIGDYYVYLFERCEELDSARTVERLEPADDSVGFDEEFREKSRPQRPHHDTDL